MTTSTSQDTIADEGTEHVAESPREGGKVPHCLSPSPPPWCLTVEAENLMSSMTSAYCNGSDFFFIDLCLRGAGETVMMRKEREII